MCIFAVLVWFLTVVKVSRPHLVDLLLPSALLRAVACVRHMCSSRVHVVSALVPGAQTDGSAHESDRPLTQPNRQADRRIGVHNRRRRLVHHGRDPNPNPNPNRNPDPNPGPDPNPNPNPQSQSQPQP